MASYTSKVIAVLGRTVRAGRWKLAEDSLVIAVFGRCSVDLSRSYVDEEDDELSMSIFSLFGSVSVVLPPGCDVEPSGVAIMSSSEVAIPSEQPSDITRVALAPLDLSFFALFSKVKIAEVPRPDGGREARSVTGSTALAGDSMAPPSIEVFDAGPALDAIPDGGEDESEPAEKGVTTATTFDDPEAQAATLRDEIAQWRAESGRTASLEDAGESAEVDDPSDEIIDESPADNADVDVAAG